MIVRRQFSKLPPPPFRETYKTYPIYSSLTRGTIWNDASYESVLPYSIDGYTVARLANEGLMYTHGFVTDYYASIHPVLSFNSNTMHVNRDAPTPPNEDWIEIGPLDGIPIVGFLWGWLAYRVQSSGLSFEVSGWDGKRYTELNRCIDWYSSYQAYSHGWFDWRAQPKNYKRYRYRVLYTANSVHSHFPVMTLVTLKPK